MVIYGGDDADKDRIYNALSTINGLNLSPALLGTDNGINVPIRVYWQGNPGLSRKQLLPALEDMLNGMALLIQIMYPRSTVQTLSSFQVNSKDLKVSRR